MRSAQCLLERCNSTIEQRSGFVELSLRVPQQQKHPARYQVLDNESSHGGRHILVNITRSVSKQKIEL